MEFQQGVDLRTFNTFGISLSSDRYVSVTSEQDLLDILPCKHLPVQVLGGGSNILLLNALHGTLIHNNILGRKIIDEDEGEVLVRIGAGENWHQFIMWCLDQELYGLENLSLIPGKVGAAPIQNIGAYGVEQESFFAGLEAIELENGAHHVFNHEECLFGYRNSFFKNEGKGKYCITAVYYRLSRKPDLKLKYGAILSALEKNGIRHPTPKDVSDVVIEIRQSKLPDPEQIGNAGSFFKNPIISFEKLEEVQKKHPSIPSYPIIGNDKMIKTSAAWLIDQCGWKGKKVGETGTYKSHALVLVNHGNATGSDIWNFAQQIMTSVKERFNIALEPEVNIW